MNVNKAVISLVYNMDVYGRDATWAKMHGGRKRSSALPRPNAERRPTLRHSASANRGELQSKRGSNSERRWTVGRSSWRVKCDCVIRLSAE